MSDETPNNGNLINFVAATAETIRDQMEGMRDRMATKDDLARLEERFTTKLEAEIAAVRGDIERIDLRLDSIEKTIRIRLDQMGAEISRLRSVIYLLAKDRPEVLRLLGEYPAAGG
jgi:hypothetical protein